MLVCITLIFTVYRFIYMPSVEDITTEGKPPRRGRFTFSYTEAQGNPEDVALHMKLRGREPAGDLGPMIVNRHSYLTCIVRQGKEETEPDICMSRPRDSVNQRASTCVYTGMTRRRLRDSQQLEGQTKRIRSLAFEILAIPITTRRRLLPSSKGPN